MRRRRRLARLLHLSLLRRPCCGRQARRVPTTAQPRPVIRPHLPHHPGITRRPHRHSSTLPLRQVTHRPVPTTALHRLTCMEWAPHHHHTLPRHLHGHQRLLRLTPQQVRASPRALAHSSRPLVLATRLRRPRSPPEPLGRARLETNSMLIISSLKSIWLLLTVCLVLLILRLTTEIFIRIMHTRHRLSFSFNFFLSFI